MSKFKILFICLLLSLFGVIAKGQKVSVSIYQEVYHKVPQYFPQFPIMMYDSEYRAFKDLPFIFLFNDITADIIDIYGPGYINVVDTTNYPIMEIATFYPYYTDQLIDKSILTGATEFQSKLYFWMDTVDAEQIFKIEWNNMGFKNCTANDSLNMQAWFFERSNKVQFRFGKSNLGDPSMLNVDDTTFVGFEVRTANNYYYGTFEGNKDSLRYMNMYAWGNVLGIPKEGTVIEFRGNETTVNTTAKKIDKGILLLQNANEITVKLKTDDIKISKMAIYNLNGARMLETKESRIDVSDLSSGMYIIKVQTTGGIYTEKFLK